MQVQEKVERSLEQVEEERAEPETESITVSVIVPEAPNDQEPPAPSEVKAEGQEQKEEEVKKEENSAESLPESAQKDEVPTVTIEVERPNSKLSRIDEEPDEIETTAVEER